MKRHHLLDGKALCDLLGCTVPVVLAGMGGVARSELVSAVSAAGAFGFLGMVREPVALLEREVELVRAAGHHAFGVNIIPAATEEALLKRQIDAIIALHVPVVELFWDIDTHVIDRLRSAGITVVYQVSSVGEAIAAERAGAQVVVAQGVEAGGHVRGVVPLRDLLPAVVDAVGVPVLAAGGLMQGADVVTAMAMGAQGVVLGTALMATKEAYAHSYHKQRLVQASASDTVLTGSFHINWPPDAPVRVLRSPGTSIDAGVGEAEVIGDEEGRPIYRFSTDSPLRSMTGDFAAMALYAGTGVGSVTSIPAAAERIEQIVTQAAAIIPDIARPPLADSSPVCFAGEFSGAYMGHAQPKEIGESIYDIVDDMRAIMRLTLAERSDEDSLSSPPFHPDAAPIAGWILLLQELCPEKRKAPETAAALTRLYLRVRHTLTTLLPRMPENRSRQVLEALAGFIAVALDPSPAPDARFVQNRRSVAP